MTHSYPFHYHSALSVESKVADLEGKIVFFDEIVQDYAADFEGRRESRDKSDYELLSRNKRMYLNGK